MLAAKIDAAREAASLKGGVGPSAGTWAPPPGPPPPPRVTATVAPPVAVRPELRGIVALGYPFWPLAIIALLDQKGSRFVRRQAWQALGFNAGMYGLGVMLSAAASIPILGLGAWPLLPFVVPLTIVASFVYAYKVWQGDDVSVPLVSDWVDARLGPGRQQPG
ncbi:MAG: DUF4870 domain-containing protein [Candidatus Eremiobacteraeota bacterium]|nr:DUF4870 domain-containing protein [Candidatus Eremiobacteraeota bacterium]